MRCLCEGACMRCLCGCLCVGVFSTVGSLACCQCPVSCICSTMKRSVTTSTLSSKGGDTTLFPVLHTCRLVCVLCEGCCCDV